MNGQTQASIGPPSTVPFTNIQAAKDGFGAHTVVFSMPSTVATGNTLILALATGTGQKDQHTSIPQVYSVNTDQMVMASIVGGVPPVVPVVQPPPPVSPPTTTLVPPGGNGTAAAFSPPKPTVTSSAIPVLNDIVTLVAAAVVNGLILLLIV